ncbi:PREDICTED: interferon-induced protein 44-like [Dipodomys ordii]|uniref:Interferon-induced protein 44-like n=1 Tax=Dipodomys ordii TaxID=10020 RepID=A0A1S3FB79_DIPOR|nr:PREDICTED: interferon-induced protein 44-like [Dipodomys ordii]
MAETTILTWAAERILRKLLGNASLTLLYKSGANKHGLEGMVQRCSLQGSTVTVLDIPNYIFGFFMLQNFPKSTENSQSSYTSSWFLSKKSNVTEEKTLFLNIILKIINNCLQFYISDKLIACIDTNKSRMYLYDSLKEKFAPISETLYYKELEIFRVEGIKKDPQYIRKLSTVTYHKEKLLAELRAYKTYTDSVSEIHILLLGPVGSGKSSFFNSVKSVFQGHTTRQAIVGSSYNSITEQYRIYSVKDGKSGKYLPFMVCDTMGLDERDGEGLCTDDIPHILKGCVPDRYQFNPREPIACKHLSPVTSSSLNRIHCVAYVLDINSVDKLSTQMISKLKQIHKEVLNCGVAHVALLTKVNNCDEVLESNFLNMTSYTTSQNQVMTVNKMLNIPVRNILMIGNSASKKELDPIKDVLILTALRQMLRNADDFLEDLPLEETASK